jgi:hypothetical protein
VDDAGLSVAWDSGRPLTGHVTNPLLSLLHKVTVDVAKTVVTGRTVVIRRQVVAAVDKFKVGVALPPPPTPERLPVTRTVVELPRSLDPRVTLAVTFELMVADGLMERTVVSVLRVDVQNVCSTDDELEATLVGGVFVVLAAGADVKDKLSKALEDGEDIAVDSSDDVEVGLAVVV